MMNVSQRHNQSHSLISVHELSIPEQVLTVLEEAWRSFRPSRVLILFDARQHLDAFLLCLEHLLHSAQEKPLLVLSSASAQSELKGRWQTVLSTDSQFLVERFSFCAPLTFPLSEQAQVCLSTVRELQLQQVEHAAQLADLFGVMVAYDVPASLSPVWKRVIEQMSARSLIVFCANPKPAMIQWCDTVVAWERND